jgi:hypothetical protein
MDKKAIFSMLTAMIISLGLFSSTVNNSDTSPDSNLTQLGVAGLYYETEISVIVVGGISAATGVSFGLYLLTGGAVNCWNPTGWGYMAGGLVL